MILLLAELARAQDAADVGAVWGLEVDGVPVGTREIRVRFEGESGQRTRFVEGWTELSLPEVPSAGRRGRLPPVALRQRLTANATEDRQASFVAVTEQDGRTIEVQAHVSDGLWQIVRTDAGGSARDQVPVRSVDLTEIDLFDPESSRHLVKLDQARILSDVTGKVEDGAVVALGPSDLRVGGEELWVETFEWLSPHGGWRFYYASNGFLVRWEASIAGRRVVANLIGPAPRGSDEFPVPSPPAVEVVELP